MGTATHNPSNTTNLQIAPSAVLPRSEVVDVTVAQVNASAMVVSTTKGALGVAPTAVPGAMGSGGEGGNIDGTTMANMVNTDSDPASAIAEAYARSASINNSQSTNPNPFGLNASNATGEMLNRPFKRGSMDSTTNNSVTSNLNLTNSAISRRWTMCPPTTKTDEGHGKVDQERFSVAAVGTSMNSTMVGDDIWAIGASLAHSQTGGDIDVDMNLDNNLQEDGDDSSSIASDSLDDYRSAFSKDDLWEEDGSIKAGEGGESMNSVVTNWGCDQIFYNNNLNTSCRDVNAGLPTSVSMESAQNQTNLCSFLSQQQMHQQQHLKYQQEQRLVVEQRPNIWNTFDSPSNQKTRSNVSPFQNFFTPPSPSQASVSPASPSYSLAFPSPLSMPPSPSPARLSTAARRNQKLLKAMQRILVINETAVEFYRAGEFDAALDALKEAECQRGKLSQTIARGRGYRSTVGVNHNLLHVPPCAPFNEEESRNTESNLEQYKRADSLGAGAPANVARTSYIYQRMDFDEGMHSFSHAESLSPSSFWSVGPDQVKSDNDYRWYEISPAVEATLVFNVGQVHRRRGEFDAAAKSYDMALEILRTVNIFSQVGASNGKSNVDLVMHPIVIPILHNIGQLQYRRGDLPLAMDTYSSALKHAQVIHGPRHVLSADALNCLGVLHYHANSSEPEDDTDEDEESTQVNQTLSSTQRAMELFRQALSIRVDSYGANHVDVATTLNNIGRIHVQRDEFDDALRYYEDALRIRRDRLGTNSLDYAATAFNAGQSLHQKGELDQAIELYQEFLRVALMKFGHSHRDVAVVLSGIAQIHQEKREYEKALELYEESLCAGRAALGEYHSEIAMLLNRIGNFHFERERLDDALRCYRRGLRIERRVLPPDHPNIVVTLSNLGEIHRQRSEWDDAAKMYCDALEILVKKHENKDHLDIASTLNTIGLIHDQRGDTCLSLRYLQDALLMRRRLLGDNHLDVAATLVYVGTILYRKGIFSVAMELFSESLRIRQAALGRDHRDVAFALYNIALVHQQRGCYEEAIEFYSETLRVEKLVLGEKHRDVSMTLFKLGEVNKAAGDLDEALRCFECSLAIERSLSTDTDYSSSADTGRRDQSSASDPAAMARTLNEIGNIHLARGDVVPMMGAFNEASRLYRAAGLSPNNVVVSGHLYALEFSCPEAAPAA